MVESAVHQQVSFRQAEMVLGFNNVLKRKIFYFHCKTPISFVLKYIVLLPHQKKKKKKRKEKEKIEE